MEQESCDDDDSETPNSTESDTDAQYKLCWLYNEPNEQCGPCNQYRVPKSGIVSVEDLDAAVQSHLINLCFKNTRDSRPELLKWNERALIENRLGRKLPDGSILCEHHRNKYGIGWRPSRHCVLCSKCKSGCKPKAKTAALAPMWLVNQLIKENPDSFPVGGKVCRMHTPVAPKPPEKRSSPSADDSLSQDDECADEDNGKEDLDQTYEPDEIMIPVELKTNSAEKGEELTEFLEISPMPFQVVETPVEQIAQSSRIKLRRKLIQVRDEAVKKFAECIAPTQGEQLIKALFEEPDDVPPENYIPPDVGPLLNAYNESADKQAKIAILSLVDHENHTKAEIQSYFNCTRYAIDAARRLRGRKQGLVFPEKNKVPA